MSSSSAQKESYPLGRSSLASTRLNLQHFVFTETFGFNVHPSIPVTKDALVADVGCGTGIWSFTFPRPAGSNVRIEASDISLAQTPPKAWLPPHVTIEQLDILDGDNFPTSLIGRYDIVHIRLFQLVIQDGDPFPVLRNLLKLLKPGGHLQWQEYDSANRTFETLAVAPKLDALNEFLDSGVLKLPPSRFAWITSFHENFGPSSEFGAKLLAHDVRAPPPHLRPMRQEVNLLSMKEYASMLHSAQPEVADELGRLVSEAEHECFDTLGRGACILTPMITWVLKKDEA